MSYAFSADSATSPAGHEVTTALSTLQALAAGPRQPREDLAKFTVFIRGVLDFAERLSIAQVTRCSPSCASLLWIPTWVWRWILTCSPLQIPIRIRMSM